MSELEARVESWARSVGVAGGGRGLALAWLPPAALLWAARRLGPRNTLPHHRTSELKPEELLSDQQLEEQFNNIFNNKRNAIHVTVDQNDLDEDKQKLEDLKAQIECVKSERETLEKNKLLGLELDFEFNKELEYYKRIKIERLQELADVTGICENLTRELNIEKNNLHDTFVNEKNDLIQCGMMYENQINENQFKEYFDANDYIYSYFKYYLKQRCDENYTKEDNIDSNFYNIDTVIHTSKKIEDAIWNYMKTQAKLNSSKECLKFHLQYDKDNNRSNLTRQRRDINLLSTMENEKDSFHIIRNFVKNQIGLALYEELKLRVMKLEILHEELDMILNKIRTVNNCGEILLSSLHERGEIKDKIINLFYSVAKFLMTDAETIQRRRDIIVNKSTTSRESEIVNEIDLLKESICKIFNVSYDIDLISALKLVNTNGDDLSKLINSQLKYHFEEFHMQCYKNKCRCKGIEEFIWDGCASQPNICNKRIEMAIYNLEKQNLVDKDKIKIATNKFIQLKTALELCSTTLK